jgi:hypothetical protein
MPSRLRRASVRGLIEDGGAPRRERSKYTDEQTEELHPEVEAFARWFADWWLRRRCGEAIKDAQRRAA